MQHNDIIGKVDNLFQAIYQKNPAEAKRLLVDTPIDFIDEKGNTFLLAAVETGQIELAGDIVAHGVPLSHRNLAGESAISLALKNKSMACLYAIVKNISDNAKDKNKALFITELMSHFNIVSTTHSPELLPIRMCAALALLKLTQLPVAALRNDYEYVSKSPQQHIEYLCFLAQAYLALAKDAVGDVKEYCVKGAKRVSQLICSAYPAHAIPKYLRADMIRFFLSLPLSTDGKSSISPKEIHEYNLHIADLKKDLCKIVDELNDENLKAQAELHMLCPNTWLGGIIFIRHNTHFDSGFCTFDSGTLKTQGIKLDNKLRRGFKLEIAKDVLTVFHDLPASMKKDMQKTMPNVYEFIYDKSFFVLAKLIKVVRKPKENKPAEIPAVKAIEAPVKTEVKAENVAAAKDSAPTEDESIARLRRVADDLLIKKEYALAENVLLVILDKKPDDDKVLAYLEVCKKFQLDRNQQVNAATPLITQSVFAVKPPTASTNPFEVDAGIAPTSEESLAPIEQLKNR